MNAADVVLAAGADEAPALITETETVRYGALRRFVGRAGNGLAAAGVRPGERVVLVLDDRPLLVAAYLGAIRIGAVPVAVNTRWSEDEIGFAIEDTGARLALVEPHYGAARHAAGGRALIATDGPFDDRPDTLKAWDAEPDDPALMIYTSGSTGRPKAAVHRHRAVRIAARTMAEVFGLGAKDRVLITSKMFFAYALGHGLLGALKLGAAVVLDTRWPKPAEVAELAARTGTTAFYSVPTFYRALLDVNPAAEGLGTVRRYVSAGERLPPGLFARWREATGAAIADGIGTSETLFMFLANPPEAPRPGSAGVPAPGAEVRLETDDGDNNGETGVLWVRLESLAQGYWRRPAETARAFRDGWFRTGDLFRRDEDGFWHHQGRADDLIRVAGQWLDPGEVEDCALATGACAEAALVGVPDADGLNRVVLFVAGATDANSAERIADNLARRLAPYKRPAEIRIVAALPRTATGKVQRYVLRDAGTG